MRRRMSLIAVTIFSEHFAGAFDLTQGAITTTFVNYVAGVSVPSNLEMYKTSSHKIRVSSLMLYYVEAEPRPV
jgi:hypothetical protein